MSANARGESVPPSTPGREVVVDRRGHAGVAPASGRRVVALPDYCRTRVGQPQARGPPSTPSRPGRRGPGEDGGTRGQARSVRWPPPGRGSLVGSGSGAEDATRLGDEAQLTVFLGVVVQLVDQVERRGPRLDQSRDGQGPGESVEDDRPGETTASSATSSRPLCRLPWSPSTRGEEHVEPDHRRDIGAESPSRRAGRPRDRVRPSMARRSGDPRPSCSCPHHGHNARRRRQERSVELGSSRLHVTVCCRRPRSSTTNSRPQPFVGWRLPRMPRGITECTLTIPPTPHSDS
jgi:hypothetical protein